MFIDVPVTGWPIEFAPNGGVANYGLRSHMALAQNRLIRFTSNDGLDA
jgi:hypothetical protein